MRNEVEAWNKLVNNDNIKNPEKLLEGMRSVVTKGKELDVKYHMEYRMLCSMLKREEHQES